MSINHNQQAVQLDARALAAIADLNKAREALRELEGARKAAETIVKEALRGFDRGIDASGNTVVTVSHRQRGSVDRKLLEAEFPEAFAATNTVTLYDVLMTSTVKV